MVYIGKWNMGKFRGSIVHLAQLFLFRLSLAALSSVSLELDPLILHLNWGGAEGGACL